MHSPSEQLVAIETRMRSALMAFFMRRLRNRAEAEDLTQDVFVRIAQTRLDSIASPDAYIFQIAANLLRDKARKDKVRSEYWESRILDIQRGVELLDPFRSTAGRQDLAMLLKYISDLPEKTRQIFILHRLENIEKATIAESFGLSVRMVEMHIRKALTTLYLRLESPNDVL